MPRLAVLRYMYFTLKSAVTSFFDILRHGMVLYRKRNEVPDEFDLDTDRIIAEMNVEELCNALNKAMYLHPEDPDTMYPEWFVELAREGVYLTGVLALNDDIGGTCVMRFNGKSIAFDTEHGHWVPAEMAM